MVPRTSPLQQGFLPYQRLPQAFVSQQILFLTKITYFPTTVFNGSVNAVISVGIWCLALLLLMWTKP